MAPKLQDGNAFAKESFYQEKVSEATENDDS